MHRGDRYCVISIRMVVAGGQPDRSFASAVLRIAECLGRSRTQLVERIE
jgi:hypothetical protein